MRITDLREEPWHIPRLSRWHHRQWAHLYPLEGREDFAAELRGCLGADPVPSTYVALEGSLLGSASLLSADLPTHPQLTPWVASVYVRRACRGRGVASALIRKLMQVGAEAGFPVLYLFTPDGEAFYRRLGWRARSQEAYQDTLITLMEIDLAKVSP